jgi:hypothetical protein
MRALTHILTNTKNTFIICVEMFWVERAPQPTVPSLNTSPTLVVDLRVCAQTMLITTPRASPHTPPQPLLLTCVCVRTQTISQPLEQLRKRQLAHVLRAEVFFTPKHGLDNCAAQPFGFLGLVSATPLESGMHPASDKKSSN